MDERGMSFPQLEKPQNQPPRKPGRLAWLDGYEFGVMTAMVLANVVAIRLLYTLGVLPAFGWIWHAQLGLAACWMTWSASPAPVRYAAPLLAMVLCASSAHPIMAWENETLGMFLQFHLPVVFAIHLFLLPTRWLGWRWRFQPAKATTSERQFSLFHLMMVLASWAAWLGYLRWENGGEVFDSILLLARDILFALMVVPVAWLVIANNRKWWLVPIVGMPLFIAVWDRLPQSYAHQILDLDLEPFVVISIWTLINIGVLYLLGLHGSTSRFAGTEAKQVVSHI